jgi:hypothetical protein
MADSPWTPGANAGVGWSTVSGEPLGRSLQAVVTLAAPAVDDTITTPAVPAGEVWDMLDILSISNGVTTAGILVVQFIRAAEAVTYFGRPFPQSAAAAANIVTVQGTPFINPPNLLFPGDQLRMIVTTAYTGSLSWYLNGRRRYNRVGG